MGEFERLFKKLSLKKKLWTKDNCVLFVVNWLVCTVNAVVHWGFSAHNASLIFTVKPTCFILEKNGRYKN